jgi:hypothetical protein
VFPAGRDRDGPDIERAEFGSAGKPGRDYWADDASAGGAVTEGVALMKALWTRERATFPGGVLAA